MEELKSAKITTLVDNIVQQSGFLGQWGLSFLLEVEERSGETHKIVFDTGAVKEGLLYNAKKLKLELSDLEYIVLSHGHSDHTAATVELLEMARREVKVVAHPHLYLPKFYVDKSGKRREGGLPKGERREDIRKAGGQVITSEKPFELFPGAFTTGEIPRVTDFEAVSQPVGGGKRYTIVDGKTQPDMILDDQALVMNLRKLGPMVITGCTHSGIVNTLSKAQQISDSKKIYGVIGGLHLVQRAESYVDQTVDELQGFGLQLISPCHCTGFRATCRVYQAFPSSFVLNFSGRAIRTGKEPKPRVI